MPAYDTLLRRLARAVDILDSPGRRTPSVAAEAAELLLQLDAKDFPTEELERQCRLLCAKFARSSESSVSNLTTAEAVELLLQLHAKGLSTDELERQSRLLFTELGYSSDHVANDLSDFYKFLKQLLAKCLVEARIKADVSQALCPSCKADRETDVLATWVHRWEHFAHSNGWWIEIYRIIRCGCTKIFSQFEYVENVGESPPVELEDGPAYFNFGLPDLVSTVTNYEWVEFRVDTPKRSATISKRQRPGWIPRIPDDSLRSLLDEVYAAVDADHRVLTAIGIRTVVDMGMQLRGAGSATGFAQRLNALVGEGVLSSEERDLLQKTTDAGSAAVHRAWRPNREEIEAMLDAMEHFLQRSDLKMRIARLNYPAKQKHHTPAREAAPGRRTSGVSKDPEASVVDLRPAKGVVTDETK